MQLNPESGVELIRDFDLNTGISEDIVAFGHDIFIGWEWKITPERPDSEIPLQLVVKESNEILTVGWSESITTLFPPVMIKYLHDKSYSIVKSWDQVPEGSQIIKFLAHPLNKRVYKLWVKATGLQISSGSPTTVEVEGTYTITILHQHDNNKQIMLNKMKTSEKQDTF